MRIGDIVVMIDTDGMTGVIENVVDFDGVKIYSIRSIYTGNLYARESDEIEVAPDEVAQAVVQDSHYLEAANSASKIVRTYPNALLTQGAIDAEVEASAHRVKKLVPASEMFIIGLNASTNMFA